MKSHASKKVIITALVGNSAIAVMKFFVAVTSGSAVMLAEAFHSTADSGNQLLLLLGLSRAKKPADEIHPFGYGKELYFWAFIVAISIFFVGAALAIYEGVHKILHPEPIRAITLPLIVIAISIVFEAYPWWVAYSEARKMTSAQGNEGLIDMAVRSKNPTVMVVLFEDSAAMIGLMIAGVGITLAYTTQNSIFDGIASISIGILLLAVALFIARETKGLLIGESATEAHRKIINEIIGSAQEVKKTGRLLTMHLGPDDLLVAMDVEFADHLSADQIEMAVKGIEARIQQALPAAKKIYIEANALFFKRH